MGIDTSIEWADSSCNAQMGCMGCELWNETRGVKRCYAGTMTAQYAGRPGWPLSFADAKIFPDRIDKALSWKDLTGKSRRLKPWLDGLPRMIFLNDMGDTFTESLPIDWLAPFLPVMERSPHVWLLLTKRASRMADFTSRYPLPPNVWPGVSITTMTTFTRFTGLLKVKGGGPKWLSIEPMVDEILLPDDAVWCRHHHQFETIADMNLLSPCFKGQASFHDLINWVIVGGESGQDARACNLDWIRDVLAWCKGHAVPCFVKQLGSNPIGPGAPVHNGGGGAFKGNDEKYFPRDLQNERFFPDPDAYKVPNA